MNLMLRSGGCVHLGASVSGGLVLAFLLTVSSMLGLLAGCAQLGNGGTAATGGTTGTGGVAGTGGTGGTSGIEPGSKTISVGCVDNITGNHWILDWQLTVSPVPIESGELFTAALEGVAVFNEFFLDAAQSAIPGGVQAVNLIELNATVHVRSGAAGDDVTLTNEPIPYECAFDGATCDPANDDSTGVPGARGNTDCQPEGNFNPCVRLIRLPTTTDCSPGGVCDGLGKTGPASQCSLDGFCITGPIAIELKRGLGEYTAASQGDVLFGWADESTGATIEEGGENPGTWNLPQTTYQDPPGPISLRLGVGGLFVVVECVMGVDSRGDYGVGSLDNLSSPTPDELLISFPIQP